jgi:hypothetical protein
LADIFLFLITARPVASIGDENAGLRSRPASGARHMAKQLDPFLGKPVVGQPNPELEHVSTPQRVMLMMIAIGFGVLAGLLLYLPFIQ